MIAIGGFLLSVYIYFRGEVVYSDLKFKTDWNGVQGAYKTFFWFEFTNVENAPDPQWAEVSDWYIIDGKKVLFGKPKRRFYPTKEQHEVYERAENKFSKDVKYGISHVEWKTSKSRKFRTCGLYINSFDGRWQVTN